MLQNNYSSLDMLTRAGILPYDANAFIYGEQAAIPAQTVTAQTTPSPQMQPQTSQDTYIPQNEKQPKPGILKKLLATAFAVYLLGVAASKGKLNPIDGLKSIYSMGSSLIKNIFNKFKK